MSIIKSKNFKFISYASSALSFCLSEPDDLRIGIEK